MARYIYASYRNKKIVTAALEAMESGEVGSFIEIFACHINRSKYFQEKGAQGPSDLKLMRELVVNRPNCKFSRDDIKLLIAAFSSLDTISPVTKMCLYFESYVDLDKSERDEVFGDNGPLEFKSQAQQIVDLLSGLPDKSQYNGELGVHIWYNNSIERDQAPEEYIEKFNLLKSYGITDTYGLSRLEYDDKSSNERYISILDSLTESERKTSLETAPILISGAILSKYGVEPLEGYIQTYFNVRNINNVLLESFLEGDESTASAILDVYNKYHRTNGIDNHIRSVLQASNNLELSEPQKIILDKVERYSSNSKAREITREIMRGEFQAASHLVMSLMLDGNAEGFRQIIKDLEGKDDNGFLSLMLSKIGESLDYYVHQGLFGPEQKEVLELLSSKVLERNYALSAKISGTSADNCWRLCNKDNQLAVIPISELSIDQRAKVIETRPAPLDDRAPHDTFFKP